MNPNNIAFYLNLELFVLPIAILCILFFNISNKKYFLLDQKLFSIMVASTFFIILSDAITFLLNNVKNPSFAIINIICSCIYYILNTGACFLWALYVDYIINRSSERLFRIAPYLSIPFVINATLSIISIFNGVLFYVDESGVYHRGNLFVILILTSALYLLYSTVYVFISKNRIEKEHYFASLFFPLPAIIASILQIYFYGITLIWQTVTISLLLVFVQIQNFYQNTDYLTGLYNRKQLDNYLYDKFKRAKEKIIMSGIMLDIDNFKKINDTFGHYAGDVTLKRVADVIKASVGKFAFIARYAGDEFVVLLNSNEKYEVEKAVRVIEKNIEQMYHDKVLDFAVTLSIGYDVYDYKNDMSADMFLKHIDLLMYEKKTNKKK